MGEIWLTVLIATQHSDVPEPEHQHPPSQGPLQSPLQEGRQPGTSRQPTPPRGGHGAQREESVRGGGREEGMSAPVQVCGPSWLHKQPTAEVGQGDESLHT